MVYLKSFFKYTSLLITSLLLTAIILFGLLWLGNFIFERVKQTQPVEYGVSFSDIYSQSLGLDPLEVYKSIVTEINVKHLRIPVYWSKVEKVKNNFSFDLYDQFLGIAAQNQVKVTLAIGYKLPRWPECFAPDWAINLDYKERQQRTLNYLEKTINHFKDSPAVESWQIENEPLFQFGLCGKTDPDFLEKEVNLARSLDTRPIIITDSGEVGLWVTPMRLANTMGSSLYKKTWHPFFGYFEYPLPPFYYSLRQGLTKAFFAPKSEGVFISELQAEPWTPGTPIILTPIEEQLEIFSLEQFKENVSYARRTNLKVVWLWGAEWWYFMRDKGHPQYWDYAKELFKPSYLTL